MAKQLLTLMLMLPLFLAFDALAQAPLSPTAHLHVPPGFVVELVAAPPLLEHPMMAGFDDPEDRFYLRYRLRHNGDQKDVQLGVNPIGAVLPAFTVHSVELGATVLRLGGRRRPFQSLHLGSFFAGQGYRPGR